jgi:hypothetical protein
MITTTASRLKPGQEMLPGAPQALHYNLDDIHYLTFTIRGDMALQRYLTVKADSVKSSSLETDR